MHMRERKKSFIYALIYAFTNLCTYLFMHMCERKKSFIYALIYALTNLCTYLFMHMYGRKKSFISFPTIILYLKL